MRACLATLALSACTGEVYSPEPELPNVGGRAGAQNRARRSGASGPDAGGGGAGAPTTATDAGTPAVSRPDAGSVVNEPGRLYCDAVALVLTPTCGNGSCHTNRGFVNGDFGAGPEEAAAYVGRDSVRNAACGLIIDPREPSDSLILTKVIGGYPTEVNCGGRMPVGSFEITDEQIECLADWVEQFRE